jgi:hypothetical protein
VENDLVLILGAGRFGGRAARILASEGKRSVWLVDPSSESLDQTAGLPVKRIRAEGVGFLVEWSDRIPDEATVVPALPVHLSALWLCRAPGSRLKGRIVDMPESVKPGSAHTWKAEDGTLLVSFADFLCPEDCPEPEGYCTVTGERRPIPMFGLLRSLSAPGFIVHVIRSRQLAPGLGGYKFHELRRMLDRVEDAGPSDWLIGTACRCHGALTAVHMEDTCSSSQTSLQP